jgi:hypothetical protein
MLYRGSSSSCMDGGLNCANMFYDAASNKKKRGFFSRSLNSTEHCVEDKPPCSSVSKPMSQPRG